MKISRSTKIFLHKAIHILLIVALLVPLLPRAGFARPLPPRKDSGASLEEAFELLETADPESYLPSMADSFDYSPAQGASRSPFDPFEGVPTSPWDMLPQGPQSGSQGSNGDGFNRPGVPNPNAGNETLLNSFLQMVDEVEGESKTANTEQEQQDTTNDSSSSPQQVVDVPPTGVPKTPTTQATPEALTGTPARSTPQPLARLPTIFDDDVPTGHNIIGEGEFPDTRQERASESQLYLPLVAHEHTSSSEPDVITFEGGVYHSPDEQLMVVVPEQLVDEPVRLSYSNGLSSLRGAAALSEEVAESRALFALEAHQVSDKAAVERVRRPVELRLRYDDAGMAERYEKYLRLRAYSQITNEWFTLPTSIDTENNTVTALTVEFTAYSLFVGFVPEDPCAIGVELVADTDFPFEDAPTDPDDDPIAQGTFHPLTSFVDNFENYAGTEVHVSGTDTGDLQETDPTAVEPTEAKDEVKMVFPLGDVEHVNEGSVPSDEVTDKFPPNEMVSLPDGTQVEERMTERTVNIELKHTADDPQWGSTGYYLVRKDVTAPVIMQFYTYHDGEGGANLYVDAYDHCAIEQITATYSNSTGGSGSTTFEYLGTATDGLGLYRAQIQLPTTGLNTYNVLVEDMADYDGPNSVTVTYSEQASNSAGFGSAELIGKSTTCSDKCGCDAACGSAGDPINTASGNFTMSEMDVSVLGVGDTDLEIQRSYNSLGSERYYAFIGAPREAVSNFGIGWTSPFQFEIEAVETLPLAGAGIKVNYPDGHSTRYAGTSGTLTPLTPGEVNEIVRSGNTFVLTDKDSLTEYHFELIVDASSPVNRAALVQKIDPNGNTTTYTPGTHGPTQISNSAGRTINLTYNGDGLITQITGPEGLSLTYGYSDLLLTSFTDERGQTTTYTYDGKYRITQITSPKGHPSLRLSYYADGRVESQIVGDAETYTITYDDGSFKRTITDSEGNAEIQQYDADYRLLSTTDAEGYTESYTYDAQNLRASLNDKNGHTYSYTYDARNNLTQTSGPLGWSQERTYNAQDKLVTMKDAEGRTTNFAYDGAGNLTGVTNAVGDSMSIAYNGQGLPVTMSDFQGNAITHAYDGSGNLTSMNNGVGHTLAFAYDGLARITSMTTHEGSAFAFTYDQASDLLTSLSGPLGYSMGYAYDPNRNMTSETDARGNTTSYEYDESENLKKITDALGGQMSFTYDSMNNQLTMSDELSHTTSYEYDKKYNLTAIRAPENQDTLYTYNGIAYPLTMNDGEGRVTTYGYDDLDRIITITDPLGGVVNLTYDLVDNITAISDANSHATTFTYDDRDLITQEQNADGENTTYNYDANGNLTSVVDGNGNSTTLTYDAANYLQTLTNAESETTSFVYNSMSNVTDITQANGVVIHLEYDELYRLAQMVNNYVSGGASDAETNVTYGFAYDLNGNATAVTDPAGDVRTYEYDALNRTTKETNELGDTQLYEYDAADNLLSLTDWRSNKTSFAFDSADHLTKITDPLAGTKQFQYDNVSNLTQYTDENSHSTLFGYDALNRPTSKTDPEGNVTQYGYDGVGNLTKLTDANTHVTQLDYDNVNRPIKLTNALSGVTTWVYDDEGNVITETDPNGHVTNIGYDKAYRVTSITDAEGYVVALEYDQNGNVTGYTDGNGNAIQYEHDPLDRVIKVTNAEAQIIRYSYDEMGNLIDFTAPHGVVTHYEYDKLDRTTLLTLNYVSGGSSTSDTNVVYALSYDANGNLTNYVDPEGNGDSFAYDVLDRPIEYKNALNQTETYQYDGAGNLRFITNRRGHTTEYGYDGADRLIKVTDALNGISSFEYDGVGNLTRYTDANTHVTDLAYDDIDRLTSVTNAEGHSAGFVYDAVGNVTQVVDPRGNTTSYGYDDINRLTSVTDALGGVMRFSYDALENITQIIDENGHTTSVTYDKIYRELTITDPEGYIERYEYDLNSNITATVNGNGNRTQYAYDALDRATTVTNPENEVQSYSYDRVGNLIDLTEADGVVTRYGYDTIYNLTSVTLNYVNGASTTNDINVLYQYAYDNNDNLTGVTDARNKSTTFAYDALDRLTKETNPLGNSWTFAYDAVGNLTQRVDANSHTTDYTYYDDDELQTIQYDDGTSVTYTYDENNNPITMLDSLGTSSFTYDELDRLSGSTDSLGRSLTYDYDAASNLTSMAYPNGGSVQYEYDDNNWLKTMTDTGGRVTTYERNGVGQRTRILQANGSISEFAYDKAERLVAVRHSENSGELIASFNYQLNDVGLRTQADVAYGRPWPSTSTENYEYDALRRVTNMTDSNGYAATYEYDAVGNRTGWKANDDQMTTDQNDGFDITYSYNDANQLVTESNDDETTTYTYDNNGNQVNKEWSKTGFAYRYGTDYSYDREDRLTNSVNYRVNDSLAAGHRRNIEETTLSYDGMGRRLGKEYLEHESAGRLSRSEYVFDGMDTVAEYPVWEEGEPVGRNNHRNEFYLDDAGDIVSQRRFPNGVADQNYWYHYDGRKNIVSLTEQTDRAWIHYRYDTYGQQLPESGNSPHPEHRTHNRYGVAGKEWDENLGMFYFGARLYDPNTATWATQDSFRGILGQPDTLNRYAYLTSDPLNQYDFYGFWGRPSWDSVKKAASNTVNKAKDVSKSVAKGVSNTAKDVVNAASEFAKDPIGNTKRFANQALETTKNLAKGVGNFLKDPLGSMSTWYECNKDNINVLDMLQTGLDVVGMIPVFGEAADALNGVIHLARGNYAEAALSFAAMVPILGNAATATKFAVKGAKAADKANDARKALKSADRAKDAYKATDKTKDARKGLDNAGNGIACKINSFTSDTPVATEEGQVPISEIEIGDQVLAYDEELHATDYYTVTNVWNHTDDVLVYITIDDELIESTLEHPFYTLEHGWLEAQDLWLGMQVQKADGSYGKIQALATVQDAQVVYNLTVAEAHTFFVGDGEWLVHNANEVCRAYDIGPFDELKKKSKPGDKLDIHHFPQKHPAGQVIPDYDPKTGTAIALPQGEHRPIPTLKGEYTGTAQELITKDLGDLLQNTNTPSNVAQDLVELVHKTYPGIEK